MNAPETPDTHRLIGAAVKRKEDYRFLTGNGQYTDDVVLPRQTFGVFLRSPYAHATIRSIDITAAKEAPGVVAIFTGADMAGESVGGLPCGWLIHNIDGKPMNEPPHPVIAHTKVRHVGDQVALIVAESVKEAKDAIELIEVDYDMLPAVVDTATAADPGQPQVHDEAPNNLCYTWGHGDKAATDAAFAKAAHVTTLDIVNQRLVPNAIEPRAVNASYSRSDDSYTVYVANQNPHVERLLMAAFVLSLPESKLRIIAPDVGGGFGSKIYLYAEDVALTWASKKVRRPIKWTCERSEAFLSDAHGRDHVTKAELAMDPDGKFLGLRVHTTANMGAYLSTFASSVPTILYATLLAGQYATPAIYAEVKAVFTNTVPVDAYRGAGRPEATYVVERIVEQAAREMKLDPAEIRRRNFITTFPYQTPVALMYDTGNYEATMKAAIDLADVGGYAARKKASEAKGKLRGLGYAAYIEACGIAPSNIAGALGARAGLFEAGEVRMHPTGSVTVFTGSHSHGQGHETTFAQVVADRLGLPLDFFFNDTATTEKILFGIGTYGSRSIAVGGTAIVKAMEKVEAKGKKIAAHLLEASEGDIVIENGEFKVTGTDKSIALPMVALAAYTAHNLPDGMEPGLKETAFYDPTNFTFPAGTYICEIEVDPATGKTSFVNFVAADDFGRLINPMFVEGQVHGGLAQGIGQALLEGVVYDSSGQLVTASFMDYTMPRADDLPSFKLNHTTTLCPGNPLGVKGCGEAGAIGASAAVINAITDAIGNNKLEMPATPDRVWHAIHG